MGRSGVPNAGRNFETFSEDPLVSEDTAPNEVGGIQSTNAANAGVVETDHALRLRSSGCDVSRALSTSTGSVTFALMTAQSGGLGSSRLSQGFRSAEWAGGLADSAMGDGGRRRAPIAGASRHNAAAASTCQSA